MPRLQRERELQDLEDVLLEAERRISGIENDDGSRITYDHQGNLYVAGVFQGRISIGLGVDGVQGAIDPAVGGGSQRRARHDG